MKKLRDILNEMKSEDDTTRPYREYSKEKLRSMTQDELVTHHKHVSSFKNDEGHSENKKHNDYLSKIVGHINDENLDKVHEGVVDKVKDVASSLASVPGFIGRAVTNPTKTAASGEANTSVFNKQKSTGKKVSEFIKGVLPNTTPLSSVKESLDEYANAKEDAEDASNKAKTPAQHKSAYLKHKKAKAMLPSSSKLGKKMHDVQMDKHSQYFDDENLDEYTAPTSFKIFLEESAENDLSKGALGIPKTLHDFLWHISAPMMGHASDTKLYESLIISDDILIEGREDAKHPDEIVKKGAAVEAQKQKDHDDANSERIKNGEHPVAYPSIRNRIKTGFHAAIPDGEHPDVTKQKAKDSQEHFRNFMHHEGGHAKNNKLNLLSQNGKTKSSSGAGRNTVGLSLAPHTTGTTTHDQRDENGKKVSSHFDVCPNASEECRKNCLGLTAGGNRQYPENSLRAKVLRQRYVTEHPEHAARLLSHEISDNEKWTDAHHSVHDKEGNIVGHKNKKTGKVDSANPKDISHADVKKKLESGEYHEKPIESGVRLNVTSDLQHEKLHPKAFFDRHHKSKFYDYTKNHGAMEDLPNNYTKGLSHTGDSHRESNSHEVIKHLSKGGISAMVYQRGADKPKPTRVKVHGSKEGEHEWKVVNGDDDDNLDDRHESAAKEHDALATHHRGLGNSSKGDISKAHHAEADKHEKTAQEYRDKKHGVVSGLELKGVKNDAAGHFANEVDHTGTIWLHDHGPQAKLRRHFPITHVK